MVEISRTAERRLLCQSLRNYLTECELLDCVQGAILSHNASRGGEFGGSRCLVPTHAVVQNGASNATAPLCLCMQTIVILSNLHIWDVKISDFDKGWCIISFAALPKVVHIFPTEEEPLEVRELAKHARLPDPRTKRTPTVSSLTKRLQKAYLHSNSGCLHNTSTEDISLCLHFESATAPSDATGSFDFRLFYSTSACMNA
ncbi:hypothetical protein RRG08_049413 [Elysia crispata]|uniref:Uncharacterized protein n=1 Tax=Elysia crispata TaxID=231223 RepID=A0AAE0ZTV1_9GAST|nr:hypothetical protein RRG08_049413 [Elysia crispata]